jgi:amidase
MEGELTSRRGLLKRGAAVSLGGAIDFGSSSNPFRTAGSGLAADYWQYDGHGLAELIAKRKISPIELLNAVHTRVGALNPKINAICNQCFDKAEAQIKQGLAEGPFKGVPFVLKDLGHQLAGTVTSFSSRLFNDQKADFDSTLVTRYKQSGLVICGKTNTPEFGLAPTTEPVLFGKTHNPWNLELTPGGSSGGAAAAVASRILPMAHATDGGGSIRIPASCCGVFGFKPTRGRVPMGPTQFEGWNGLSAQHALTISVRDSAALLDISAGPELGAPYWAPPPQRRFLEEIGKDPGKLRIALVLTPPSGVPLHPECKNAAAEAAKLCESLGHSVEEATLPVDGAALDAARTIIAGVSIARTLEDCAKRIGRPVSETDVEPVTWMYSQTGLKTGSVAYSRAIASCHQFGLAMAKFQQRFDVILSPTLAKPPVRLGLLSPLPEGVGDFLKERRMFTPFTALYNTTGQPSMSVPLYWSADGLPIGVMFSGRFGEDGTLFRLASQLERAKPWAGRRPNV